MTPPCWNVDSLYHVIACASRLTGLARKAEEEEEEEEEEEDAASVLAVNKAQWLIKHARCPTASCSAAFLSYLAYGPKACKVSIKLACAACFMTPFIGS